MTDGASTGEGHIFQPKIFLVQNKTSKLQSGKSKFSLIKMIKKTMRRYAMT